MTTIVSDSQSLADKASVPVPLLGGLDLVTDKISANPGTLADCLNYEVTREAGYSRFRGLLEYSGKAFILPEQFYIARKAGAGFDPGPIAGGPASGGIAGSVVCFAEQSDGKILIGGAFDRIGGVNQARLARLHPDGSLDASFRPTLNRAVQSITVLDTGKIMIGGQFTLLNGEQRNGIARLNIDGTTDAAFNTMTTSPGVFDIVQVPGTTDIVIGGIFSNLLDMDNMTPLHTVNLRGLARLEEDGSLSDDWRYTLDAGEGAVCHSLSIDSGNSILYAGGDFSRLVPLGPGVPEVPIGSNLIDFLLSNGAINSELVPSFDLPVRSVQFVTANEIYVGGEFTEYAPNPASNPSSVPRAIRVESNGDIVATYSSLTNGHVNDIVRHDDPSDGVIITGNFAFSGRENIVRANTNGTIDNFFTATTNDTGTGTAHGILGVHIRADDKILIGGTFDTVNSIEIANMAQLNPDGTIDLESLPGNLGFRAVESGRNFPVVDEKGREVAKVKILFRDYSEDPPARTITYFQVLEGELPQSARMLVEHFSLDTTTTVPLYDRRDTHNEIQADLELFPDQHDWSVQEYIDDILPNLREGLAPPPEEAPVAFEEPLMPGTVPGSGPVLGLFELDDDIYAVRGDGSETGGVMSFDNFTVDSAGATFMTGLDQGDFISLEHEDNAMIVAGSTTVPAYVEVVENFLTSTDLGGGVFELSGLLVFRYSYTIGATRSAAGEVSGEDYASLKQYQDWLTGELPDNTIVNFFVGDVHFDEANFTSEVTTTHTLDTEEEDYFKQLGFTDIGVFTFTEPMKMGVAALQENLVDQMIDLVSGERAFVIEPVKWLNLEGSVDEPPHIPLQVISNSLSKFSTSINTAPRFPGAPDNILNIVALEGTLIVRYDPELAKLSENVDFVSPFDPSPFTEFNSGSVVGSLDDFRSFFKDKNYFYTNSGGTHSFVSSWNFYGVDIGSGSIEPSSFWLEDLFSDLKLYMSPIHGFTDPESRFLPETYRMNFRTSVQSTIEHDPHTPSKVWKAPPYDGTTNENQWEEVDLGYELSFIDGSLEPPTKLGQLFYEDFEEEVAEDALTQVRAATGGDSERTDFSQISNVGGGGYRQGEWANLSDVSEDDTNAAVGSYVFPFLGSVTQTLELTKKTSVMRLRGFELDLPEDGSVVGIEVKVRSRAVDPAHPNSDLVQAKMTKCQLMVPGGIKSTNRTEVITGSYTDRTYGSGTDTWELTNIDPEKLNDENFGIDLQFSITAEGNGNNTSQDDEYTVDVAYVELTVYYRDIRPKAFIWDPVAMTNIMIFDVIHAFKRKGDWDLGDAEGVLTVEPGLSLSFPVVETLLDAIDAGMEIRTESSGGGQLIGTVAGFGETTWPNHQSYIDNKSRTKTIKANFFADERAEAVWGVTGAGPAFMYNGNNFVYVRAPIPSGKDKPRHIAEHQQHLVLGYISGHALVSVVGEPLNFSGVDGASEWGFGDPITGLTGLFGNALGVFCRSSAHALIGNSIQNFTTQTISKTTGAKEYTVTNMGQPLYVDTQGLSNVSASENYGDFVWGRLSSMVYPFLHHRLQDAPLLAKRDIGPVDAMPVRNKGQYRLFFNDGWIMTTTLFGHGEQVVPMFTLQHYDTEDFSNKFVPSATLSTVMTTGQEVLLIGTDEGKIFCVDAANAILEREGEDLEITPMDCFIVMNPMTMERADLNLRYREIFVHGQFAGYDELFGSLGVNYLEPDPPTFEEAIDIRSPDAVLRIPSEPDKSAFYLPTITDGASLKIRSEAKDIPPHTLQLLTYRVQGLTDKNNAPAER